ncbi:MAG: amidohydrolase family protein [Reichenbachiella sp.]
MKIDAHQHFWEYEPVRDSWITDDMAVLQRDFLPKDLAIALQENAVDGCVAIQADQSNEETDFLLQLADHNELIKGVVGWVDLRAEDIETQLKDYSDNEKLVGFRHIIQSEADPNFILEPKFQNGISLLEKFGFTYDILVFPHQLEAVLETIIRHPKQKFVIDHMAKPNIKGGEVTKWKEQMIEIGSFSNVSCKISGLVTEADWLSWEYGIFVPYIDVIVQCFGTNRIMFGSDWPVCLLAGSYKEVKGIVDRYFEKFSNKEREKMFGQNAIDFYGIGKSK